MTNIQSHAQIEFDILKNNVPDAIILEFKDEILALCEKFGMSGQSGGSAPYVSSAISSAIKKLCMQEAISSLTGEDDEWFDQSQSSGEFFLQNKRNSAVFKDKKGVWYLDAIVWCADTPGDSGNNWDNFCGTVEGIKSSQYIKSFPFEPKTFRINVTKELLPADWKEEPYFEEKSYYIAEEFATTGIKNWVKGDKYRYVIKDMKQLDEVWEHYKKLENE